LQFFFIFFLNAAHGVLQQRHITVPKTFVPTFINAFISLADMLLINALPFQNWLLIKSLVC